MEKIHFIFSFQNSINTDFKNSNILVCINHLNLSNCEIENEYRKGLLWNSKTENKIRNT